MSKTPEEIEEARRIVAEANAAQAHAQAEALIAALSPLTDLGIGTDEPITITLGQLAAGLREAAKNRDLPQNLSNLAFQLSTPLETFNFEVKNRYQQAQQQLIPEQPE